ncbi:MAG: phosphoribosylanthranilate isomerase [Acidobacteriota bacterium]
MSKVRVKICGIRTFVEASAAVEQGADALGFNFWTKSPRYLAPDEARKIIHRLPPFVSCVGVFVNESAVRINQIVEQTGINAVQLHGDETPEFIGDLLPVKIIKAFRVGEDFDINVLTRFSASAFLLDAKVKGEYGGTGMRFDWRIAIEAQKIAPIILAGGLTSANVSEAIQFVRPFAVDVCSGVEAEPGRKDLQKLREFLNKVRQFS